MISREKQFIFVHNYKTGGTSIEKKLGHFEVLERDIQDHRTIAEIELLTKRGKHLRTALYAMKKGKASAYYFLKKAINPELTKREFNTFYKFSFVRNSWARIYSWYVNVMKDELLRKSYGIDSTELSFEDFLRNYMDHDTFGQLYFLTGLDGSVPMDFIGRFENLQQDFNIVCERLQIEDPILPRMLVRKYGHYTENYSSKTKALVYELYKEEIRYFKFEFGE